MNISNLILEGKLLNIKIGENADRISNLESISVQQGDIPALYGYYIDHLYFEITVIENTVVGIQFDLSYDTGKVSIETKENKIELDGKTTFSDLVSFLKSIDWDFDHIGSEVCPKRIVMNRSECSFYFNYDDRLLKINNFDMKLYKKLTN